MAERDIQNEILISLGSRKDVRLWRQNAGVARSMESNNVIRMGVAGCADLTGIVTISGIGIRLEVEVKTQKGRQSDQQIRFEKMVRDRGGIYILARSVDDAILQLEEAINEIGYKLTSPD
jgi:hypothetical protein